MEVPRIEVKLELQLLAYTTATATRNPSRVCDLHHMDTSRVCNPLSHNRDSHELYIFSRHYLLNSGRCLFLLKCKEICKIFSNFYLTIIIKKGIAGVLLWYSRLRIQHCHCCGLGHCYGACLIPGLGTLTGCGHSQKKKKKEEEKYLFF